MIPAVKFGNGVAFIPFIDEAGKYACINWDMDGKALEVFEDMKYPGWASLRSNICLDEGSRDEDEPSSTQQILQVYELTDLNTGSEFLMVAYYEIRDFDDIKHCVALPYNYLNVIKFYKEYVMTFADT